MEPKKTSESYSPEVRARAVRMVMEHQGEHASQWAAIGSIAAKIGCNAETLRGWVRQAERDRGRRDAVLEAKIRRVWEENFQVYGVRKVWRQLGCEGIAVARCTVARLMRRMGLAGVIRGKAAKTTVSNRAAPCPADRVNRQFRAPRPNALWVSDVTCVATWQGFVYVAFGIDAFARRIVGWRVSRTAHAGFVLDALEQALGRRRSL